MEKAGKAKTTLFEGFLVLGLDKEWLDVFRELPEFEVQIDNKRKLHLISIKSI